MRYEFVVTDREALAFLGKGSLPELVVAWCVVANDLPAQHPFRTPEGRWANAYTDATPAIRQLMDDPGIVVERAVPLT